MIMILSGTISMSDDGRQSNPPTDTCNDGIDNDGDGSSGQGMVLSEDVFSSRSYGIGDTVVTINYDTYERALVSMPADGITIQKSNSQYIFMPGDILEEIPRNLIGGKAAEDQHGLVVL